MELQGHMVTLYFNLLEELQDSLFFQSGWSIVYSTSNVWAFQFLHILSYACCYSPFIIIIIAI